MSQTQKATEGDKTKLSPEQVEAMATQLLMSASATSTRKRPSRKPRLFKICGIVVGLLLGVAVDMAFHHNHVRIVALMSLVVALIGAAIGHVADRHFFGDED